jgi:lipoprotein-anchoring transpeptidase ErfK/SrfK
VYAGFIVVAVFVTVFGERTALAESAASARSAPTPVEPAFGIPAPKTLAGHESAQWAPVNERSTVRVDADAASPVVAQLPLLTPEQTTNIVRVLDRRATASGLWVKVSVPGIPQSKEGWVPREALGSPRSVGTELVVDRARHRVTLTRNGRVVFTAPAAVGASGSPTPTGTFYIRNRLTKYRSAFYGPIAFGTSARSAVLTDWPAGGFVGIHGTDRPDLVPGDVSHGCVRLKNQDIVTLDTLMPIGTPVTIT